MNKIETPEVRDRLDQSRMKWTSSWWQVVLAGAAALILGLGFLRGLELLAWPLAILILGVTIAAALEPLVEWLDRWLPRTVGIVLVYLILLLLVIGIGWLVFPPLVNQVQEASDRIPQLFEQARQSANQLIPGGNLSDMSLTDTVTSQLSNFSTTLVSLPLRIFSSLLDLVLIIFISIYSLIVAPAVLRFISSLFPGETRERVNNVLSSMVQAMGGYVRGVLIDSLIVGVLTYIGLLLIGIDFALALGLLMGVMEIIPIVGPAIGGMAIVAVALLQSPTQALIALIFVIILQQVESNILVPNIMRTQAEISPLLTILALVAGHSIGGFLGVLIAIPLAAALRVFVREVIAPAVRQWTGAPARA